LRNVALNQPYFHNGSRSTLEQVVEFYNRGGDRRGPDDNDTTGLVSATVTDGGATNVHPAIHNLNMTTQETSDLVAFLRHALTDPRVACESAPFDHPELTLFDGHVGDEKRTRGPAGGLARDDTYVLPATGAAGRALGTCLRNDNGTKVLGTEAPPPAASVPVKPPKARG
jgi:hypothetical protein